MIYNPLKREIISGKEINKLDRFVLNFISLLKRHNIGYVIVSGYVSIVLGRARATEDVDMLICPIELSKFIVFFNDLMGAGYECANTMDAKEAFDMLGSHAVRFYEKDKPIPNIEFKFMKKDLDRYSFENKTRLITNGGDLFISPLALHVAFKLFLAADGIDEELQSDKDIEDARFVYKLFKEKINKEELYYLVKKLNVEKRMRWLE
jgi:hypothetical protein